MATVGMAESAVSREGAPPVGVRRDREQEVVPHNNAAGGATVAAACMHRASVVLMEQAVAAAGHAQCCPSACEAF